MVTTQPPISITIINNKGVPYTFYSNGRGSYTVSHPVHNKMNTKITKPITKGYFMSAYNYKEAIN